MESKAMVKANANVREDWVKKRFCFPVLVSFPYLKGFRRENLAEMYWSPCSPEV